MNGVNCVDGLDEGLLDGREDGTIDGCNEGYIVIEAVIGRVMVGAMVESKSPLKGAFVYSREGSLLSFDVEKVGCVDDFCENWLDGCGDG